MPTSETFPFAPQTPHAVGRDRELQAIKQALGVPEVRPRSSTSSAPAG